MSFLLIRTIYPDNKLILVHQRTIYAIRDLKQLKTTAGWTRAKRARTWVEVDVFWREKQN